MSISTLPNEILKEILSFLTPEEITTFSLVCKDFNSVAKMDDSWMQPLLNRLKEMDPTISISPALGDTEKVWRYSRFTTGMKKIASDQLKEINFLLEDPTVGPRTGHSNKTKLNSEMCTELRSLIQMPYTLKTIEYRHQVLDRINATLIRTRIKFDYNLSLVSVGLTRFPATLFEAPDLKHYWRNVKSINLYENRLRNFPNTISQCQALTTLCLQDNYLSSVPASLADCSALKELNCKNNYIQDFPMELKNKLGTVWSEKALADQECFFRLYQYEKKLLIQFKTKVNSTFAEKYAHIQSTSQQVCSQVHEVCGKIGENIKRVFYRST